MTDAPFSGIKVVDCTELLPGPLLSRNLRELGATIVKIERPGRDRLHTANPQAYEYLNRGKSIRVLDLKTAAGKNDLLAELANADVFLEGFRPGVMKRLGLDYDTVGALNRRLIYLSLSGYGQTGAFADRSGHDINYIAASGIAALSGDPADGPRYELGIPLADLNSVTYSLAALAAALYQRSRTENGQYLDVSIADCAAHLLNYRRVTAGRESFSAQRRSALVRPAYGLFNCKDGVISLAALENHFWNALVGYLDTEALRRPQYGEMRHRIDDAETINAVIAAVFAEKTINDLEKDLIELDIPALRVLAPDEVPDEPPFEERRLFGEKADGLPVAVFPVRLEGMAA